MAVCPRDPGIERALLVAEVDKMAGKKSAEPSPGSIARAERQRLALEEGARAMADIQRRAIAIRKNMQRLRTLREAKEAEEAKTQPAIPVAVEKKRKKGLSK